MKKLLVLVLAFSLLAAMAACVPQPETPEVPDGPVVPTDASLAEPIQASVGISLPNTADLYWKRSAEEMTRQLEAMGHTVTVANAGGKIEEQVRQIRELIDKDVDCLVIAAIDSLSLLKEQEVAKLKGISVIAYDRMLMDSDAVYGFVSCDFAAMGSAVGQQIIAMRQLETAAAEQRSYTVEFFMGSPDDNNALLFHQGLLKELQPYLESGALVCRTGRTSFEDTCTPGNDEDLIKFNFLDRLDREYPTLDLDICCTGSDVLAYACQQILEKEGFTEENWPLITGQGGGTGAIKRIVAKTQTITVYKDPLVQAKTCAQMVNRAAYGLRPDTGSITSNNHVLQVPAIYCPATVIHPDNYVAELLDKHIYTQQQVTPDPTETTAATETTPESTSAG